MRDATKWMRRSSCSWRKEGTRRQQKYLTVIKQFSTTRTLLPLILSTEGLLGKNLEKNLRKVTLKDISGTKSLSPVTKSFLAAVDCLGILIPSTRGKHISITLSAAVPHSPSLWLWNLYLAFWAEKSKVAVCDASSTAALYNMWQGFITQTQCVVWALSYSFLFLILCTVCSSRLCSHINIPLTCSS